MLAGLWFGFDFDQADLPDEPLLHGDDPPRWVGTLPGSTFRTGISDAKVTVETDGFEQNGDCEDGETTQVTPKRYIVTVEAHRLDRAEVFTCRSWHEVQQRCRRMEHRLDESHVERHAPVRTSMATSPQMPACSANEAWPGLNPHGASARNSESLNASR